MSDDEGGAEVEDEKAEKGRDVFGRREEETPVGRASPAGRAPETPKGGRASEMPEERASETPGGRTSEATEERAPETSRERASETLEERAPETPEERAVELPMSEPEARTG